VGSSAPRNAVDSQFHDEDPVELRGEQRIDDVGGVRLGETVRQRPALGELPGDAGLPGVPLVSGKGE
jgi:hypothetical protein